MCVDDEGGDVRDISSQGKQNKADIKHSICQSRIHFWEKQNLERTGTFDSTLARHSTVDEHDRKLIHRQQHGEIKNRVGDS